MTSDTIIIESARDLMRQGIEKLGMAALAATMIAGSPAMVIPSPAKTKTVQVTRAKMTPTWSTSFLDYIKRVENAGRVGWEPKKRRWFPHKSPEGGRPTIAWGHKIQSDAEEDRLTQGITEAEATKLLAADLDSAWKRARSYVRNKLGVDIATLTMKQQEILADYSFNPGLSIFPKFTQAVVENEWETALSEHARKLGGKPLARNKEFLRRYFGD
jgi:GH24 family phage-related lysozyme (muramidase)